MTGCLLREVALFTALPIATMIAGAAIAAFRVLTATLKSAVQHFAAGLVFAVVADELLPKVMHARLPLSAAIGFAVGTGLMLVLRMQTAGKQGSRALLAGVGTDIFIDGLLIGIGFVAGTRGGVLLSVALAVEILFLGMATSSSLVAAGIAKTRAVMTTSALAGLLVIGAGLGATVLSHLGGSSLEALLAFGCAALLYLVTEELLVEAHELPHTPATTAMFFVGFLALLLVEMIA
jgi:ZIP family zinc transporter